MLDFCLITQVHRKLLYKAPGKVLPIGKTLPQQVMEMINRNISTSIDA